MSSATEAVSAEKPLPIGLITISIMLATIMQALDTTIANVALPHMQGSLSATQDQVSWILTSYIVAAAIMTPPTGILASKLGRKRLFLICVVGFTIASMLCGISMTLLQMVVFRLIQGIFGAGLVPLSQSVLLDIYPKEKHGQAMALWGVGVMLGPILGPSLGGWLTEYYDWRWVFYINLPIGIMAFLGILTFLPESAINKLRRFDIFGFLMLSISIGALQMMLDRGQGEDWFSSPEIIIEAILFGLCFYMFAVHILTAKHPFLDPGMFKDRTFVTCMIFMFIVGIILLSTMALLPPFLQTLKGYPVITTGMVLAPRGIGTMVAMMLVGKLMGKIDVRLLLLFGLVLTGYTLWEMSLFNLDVSEGVLIRVGILQGFGMGFVFVPLSATAFSTLAPHYRNDATSVFSLMRNIGSSIGISIMIALLAQYTQVNHAEIGSGLTINSTASQLLLMGVNTASYMDTTAGLSYLNAEVTRQAATIAYINDFRLMVFINLAAVPLLLFMKVPKKKPTKEELAAAME